MNKPFEQRGLWFLPGHDDKPIAGLLKFDPARDPELELMGFLDGAPPAGMGEDTPDLILGITSGGTYVTLFKWASATSCDGPTAPGRCSTFPN